MWPTEENDGGEVLRRLQSYAVKATREAMIHTRWTQPNLEHEEGLAKFIAAMLDGERNSAFLEDFRRFQGEVAEGGMLNSLSQTLFKITTPGVPDFYQGSEVWDWRLVDPDNRGPVDFKKRSTLLKDLSAAGKKSGREVAAELLENWRDGRIKLFLIWKALATRAKYRQLFSEGEFRILKVSGQRAENIMAFLRTGKNGQALIVAPKWTTPRGSWSDAAENEKFWSDTMVETAECESKRWVNVFTNEEIGSEDGQRGVKAGWALRDFPVALLISQRR